MTHTISVNLVEFSEGHHTIWVQSMNGTVLRIKCTGRIKVNEGCENPCSHADILVQGGIEFCYNKNDSNCE